MLNRKLKISFIAVFLVIFAFLLHFILHPLFSKSLYSIFVHKLQNLQMARNYYSTVSSVVTTFSSFAGVTLGLFYYFHKKETDEKSGKTERVRNRIKTIFDQLTTYDSLVDEIISRRISNDKELAKARDRIARCPEMINAILDNNLMLLNFTDDEINQITKLFSFVEKNNFIMQMPYTELFKNENKYIKEEYIELIQETRKVCYLKSE